MSCIFCSIVEKKIPANIVAENDKYLAFLDIFPVQQFHTLVIPKVEKGSILDFDPSEVAQMYEFARPIALAQHKLTNAKRISFTTVGLDVDHFHWHLIPINKGSDLNFSKTESPTQDELVAQLKQLQSAMKF